MGQLERNIFVWPAISPRASLRFCLFRPWWRVASQVFFFAACLVLCPCLARASIASLLRRRGVGRRAGCARGGPYGDHQLGHPLAIGEGDREADERGQIVHV